MNLPLKEKWFSVIAFPWNEITILVKMTIFKRWNELTMEIVCQNCQICQKNTKTDQICFKHTQPPKINHLYLSYSHSTVYKTVYVCFCLNMPSSWERILSFVKSAIVGIYVTHQFKGHEQKRNRLLSKWFNINSIEQASI